MGYEDDLNLYAYVRNDPVNMVDVTGRRAVVRNDNIYIRPERGGGPNVTVRNTVRAEGFTPRNLSFHTYDVRTPTGLSGAGNLRALGDSLRANPTPGVDRPASAEGTLNNVGPLPLTGPTNYVGSFSIASPDPSRYTDIVVNYTVGGQHALEEGFVMRYGEMADDGSITLRSYGEGEAWQQDPLLKGIWEPAVDNVWQENQQQIVNDCVQNGTCQR